MLLLVFLSFLRILFLTVSKLEIWQCLAYLAIASHWREREYIFNGVILPCHYPIKKLETAEESCEHSRCMFHLCTSGMCTSTSRARNFENMNLKGSLAWSYRPVTPTLRRLRWEGSWIQGQHGLHNQICLKKILKFGMKATCAAKLDPVLGKTIFLNKMLKNTNFR